MDTFVLVLKWVLLIFLAGVVGQFGKSLTLKLLASWRDRRKKTLAGKEPQATLAGDAGTPAGIGSGSPAPGVGDTRTAEAENRLPLKGLKAEQKHQKKMQKLEVKKAKKRKESDPADG